MKQRGFTLIATLITVAIICVLMVVMMQGYGGPVSNRADGMGKTIPGAAKLTAEDEVCKNNLGQVRQGLAIANLGADGHPESIQDAHIGEQFYSCPVGHEPYQYNPKTGEVHCVHPGHESF